MRVIVTGANGFVGTHTVTRLLDRGNQVVALDLSTEGLSKLFKHDPNCQIVKCDIVNEKLEDYISQGDKILHLAAIPRFDEARQNPQRAVRVNVEGTLNIVQACIKKKAERIVYSSTGSVYSRDAPVPIREDAPREPDNIYGLTKKQAEDWILMYSNRLPHVILRYGYVYGKGKDWGAIGAFLKGLKEGKRPTVFGGKQTNDFIYVKDIVQANLLALESYMLNQTYNIGSGRATSIKDVCELCIKAMRSTLKMEIKPARAFDFLVFVYDISKAQTLLGFEPKWNIHDGIEDSLK